MGWNIRRRLPALLAATALAGGLAAVTAAGASAETAATATALAKASGVCAKTNGEYHGRLYRSYKILGTDPDTGKRTRAGGTLQVWRSATCKTIWVRTVKDARFTHAKRETAAGITYYDAKKRRNVRVWVSKNTTAPVQTPAVRAGGHKVVVEGGFVGDYQYDSVHTVRF